MAKSGKSVRRIEIFSVSSTTPKGAGPYKEVFERLMRDAPFETKGAFGRRIRVNNVQHIFPYYFMELYLIIDQLDVLEVSAAPDTNDEPTFVVPSAERTFAARTCAIFDIRSRSAAIEYIRSGPKMVDFMEVLTEAAFQITRQRGTEFSLSPKIGKNFLNEIDQFERVRQVRVVFERPNPGWGDISILSDELEGSNDARREVVLTAPRTDSIRKNHGILRYIRRQIQMGKTAMSRVVLSGKRQGDVGETSVSSDKSTVTHSAALPVTDDEGLYRRSFINIILPFLNQDSDDQG